MRRSRAFAVLFVLFALGCSSRLRVALPRPTLPLAATPADAITLPERRADVAPALPAPRMLTLPNGLQIAVVERHETPNVAVVFAGRGSGRDDADAPRGSDVLLDWVMTDESDRYPGAFAIDVSPRGAQIFVGVGSGYTGEAIANVAHLVTAPRFGDEAVTRARRALDREIALSADSIRTREEQHLDDMLYGADDPRSMPWWGDRAVFRSLGRGALLARHRSLFAPSTSILIVVGDVSADDVFLRTQLAFSGWSSPAPATRWLPAPTFPDPSARVHGLPVSGHESTFHMREHAPPLTHADHPAFEVVEALLGGMFGSRLNMQLREELGHTYSVHTQTYAYGDHGVFELSMAVAGAATRSTVFSVVNEMRRLGDPAQIEETELALARAHAIAQHQHALRTPDGIARSLAASFVVGEALDAEAARIARIRAVDSDEVARVARTWLRSEHSPMVVVGEWDYLYSSMTFIPGGYQYVQPR